MINPETIRILQLPEFVTRLPEEARRAAAHSYLGGHDADGYCIVGRVLREAGIDLDRYRVDPEVPDAESLADAAELSHLVGGDPLGQLYYPDLQEDLEGYMSINDGQELDEEVAKALLGVD